MAVQPKRRPSGGGGLPPEVAISAVIFLLSVIVTTIIQAATDKAAPLFTAVCGSGMAIGNFVIGMKLYRLMSNILKVRKDRGAEKIRRVWPKSWPMGKRLLVILVVTFITSWLILIVVVQTPIYLLFVSKDQRDAKLQVETLASTNTCLVGPKVDELLSRGFSDGFEDWLKEAGYNAMLQCADQEADPETKRQMYESAAEWAKERGLDASAAERAIQPPTATPEPTSTPTQTPTPGPTQTPVIITTVETVVVEATVMPTASPRDLGITSLTVNTVDMSQYPVLAAYVVFNPEIQGLLPTDFEVELDGVRRSVEAVALSREDQATRYFAIVFDGSGSMNENGRLQASKEAAIAFLGQLTEKDRVRVYVFADQVSASQWDTAQTAMQTVNSIGASGETALYQAVLVATSDLSALPGRKFMVVLSDGEDTVSSVPLDFATSALQTSQASAFVINAGGDPTVLAQIAQASQNGQVLDATDDPSALQTAFTAIAEQIKAEWRVIFFAADQAPTDAIKVQICVGLRRICDVWER